MTSIDLMGSLEYQSKNERLQSDIAEQKSESSDELSQGEIIQIIVTFLFVTICVCMLISVTYVLTKPVIAEHDKAKAAALNNAAGLLQFVKSVIPNAESITKSGTWQNNDVTAPYFCVANKDGSAAYAIISYAKGYSSTLKVLTGIDNAGNVIKIDVLEQAETPGLGEQVLGDEFKKQFEGAHKNKIKVTTSGEADAIQAITGATISSRAVTEDAVLSALKFYETELAGK